MSANNQLAIPIYISELTIIKSAINSGLDALTTRNNSIQIGDNIREEMIEKLDFVQQIITNRSRQQGKANQLKGASTIILSKEHCAPMSVMHAGKCGCPYQSIRNITSMCGLSQDEIK